MKLLDQHLHSKHSFDSKAEPAEVCRHALAAGLAGLTFTEHYDTHPSEWPTCVFDYARITDEHAALRAEFGDCLAIGTGIEVCYQPDHMPAILEVLERQEYDLVILSVHWFYGKAIHFQESWEAGRHEQTMRRYLQAVLDAVRLCADLARKERCPFHVLGHLDFAKRYSHIWWQENHVAKCRDVVEEILRTCLEADLIPEINMSTLRRGLDEPMPDAWAVRRYRELGGRCMSVGSDAHRAHEVGQNLPVAAGMIADAGLDGLAVFTRGRRRVEPVPSPAPRE